MNRSMKLLARVAVGGALVVAGCGDDEETSSTTTTPEATVATGTGGGTLTKEEFITEADQICAAGDETITAAGDSLGQSPSNADLEQFTGDVIVPSIQSQYDAIAALPVPEGEEEQVAELLSALQSGIDELEADPSLITAGDSAESPFAGANKLAKKFGLTDCGEG